MAFTLTELTWPHRTERLTIRPATLADAEATWHYRRLESVAEYLPSLPPDLPTHRSQFTEPMRLAHTLIVEHASEPGVEWGQYAENAPGHENAVIGDLKLDVTDLWAQTEVADAGADQQAEIGWAFDPAFQGRGLATEAVREALRIAFDDLAVRRCVAYCFAENQPSWRLMERVGMRCEAHHVADGYHRSGRWLDGLFYAMLADEWRALAQ